MTMPHSHLSDDRLIDVCLEAVPLASEWQHLDNCPACEERRARLVRLLTDVADVAAAEADVAFPAERLAIQRARILQRIEREGQLGRVITFPASHQHGSSLRARPGMRWIAGAAAAGLIIGVAAGHLAHQLPGAGTSRPPAVTAAEPATGALQLVSMPQSEEEFLGRMETAVDGTAGYVLQPLDDLTPFVWEVAAQ